MSTAFLKMIGNVQHPLTECYKLPYADFTRHPRQIRVGDLMVLYAVGAGKRIFALVKVESEVRRVDQEKYPFRLDISYLINLHPSLGVPISDITTAKRDLVRPIQWGLSYFWLHPEEFTLAESKLKEVDKMLRASKK